MKDETKKKLKIAIVGALILLFIIIILVLIWLSNREFKNPKIVEKPENYNININNFSMKYYDDINKTYPVTKFNIKNNEIIKHYDTYPTLDDYITTEIVLKNQNYNVSFGGILLIENKTENNMVIDSNITIIGNTTKEEQSEYVPRTMTNGFVFKDQIALLTVTPKTDAQDLKPERKVYYKLPKKINPDQMVQIVIDENGKIH